MCDVNVSKGGDESMTDGDYQPALDISALPQVVKNRVKALKKLQFETVKAEEEYYSKVHALDLEYQKQYDEINAKRLGVISGKHEPTGDEIEWPSDEEEDKDEEKTDDKISEGLKKVALADYNDSTTGIPKFWYHVLKNANDEVLMSMIETHDEAVLESLVDITLELKSPENTGFTLKFHFAENEWFSNPVLTKEYELRPGHDPESPLEYDGPEIFRCKGCKIDWKEGKDVTKRKVEVKTLSSRNKGSKSPKKVITKEVEENSFFDFFSPPDVPEDPTEEMEDEDRGVLAVDFDVGFSIKEKIIPRAVLYFTGEALEDGDDYEDISSSEEEEDEDED